MLEQSFEMGVNAELKCSKTLYRMPVVVTFPGTFLGQFNDTRSTFSWQYEKSIFHIVRNGIFFLTVKHDLFSFSPFILFYFLLHHSLSNYYAERIWSDSFLEKKKAMGHFLEEVSSFGLSWCHIPIMGWYDETAREQRRLSMMPLTRVHYGTFS